MKPKRRSRRARHGLSLLELMATAAITAAIMTSSMVVIRSSYAAWQAHEGDMVRSEAAHATVRHIVRGIRQAGSVVSITPSSDTTGRLEMLDGSGATIYWEHLGDADGSIVYSDSGAILAKGIDQLIFTGYEADGVTTTTTADDVQLIRCTAQVTLPRGAGQTRTVSCYGWVRSW